MIKKLLAVSSVCIVIALAVLALSPRTVDANPTFIGVTQQTATATTSPAYVGVGTATSTVTYDSYAPTTNLYFSSPLEAALLIQFTASSTSSVLAVNLEYSNDGIDWYKDTIMETYGHSTSTPVIDLGTFTNSMVWKAASTARTNRIILIPTPTRYVRVISSLTGAAGAVWVQVAPIKEKN